MRSSTASTIQSQSANLPRSSSRLPGSISLAAPSCMNAAGSALRKLATAPSARALRLLAPCGTMSSKHDGNAGIGDMGGDARAHRAGADDADFLESGRPSHAFQNGGDALAAADALARQRITAAGAGQQRRGLAGDAGAGGAQRMAERNGAAIEVQSFVADAEFAGAGQRLAGERLVQFDDVDGARSRCLREPAPSWWRRPGRCP